MVIVLIVGMVGIKGTVVIVDTVIIIGISGTVVIMGTVFIVDCLLWAPWSFSALWLMWAFGHCGQCDHDWHHRDCGPCGYMGTLHEHS